MIPGKKNEVNVKKREEYLLVTIHEYQHRIRCVQLIMNNTMTLQQQVISLEIAQKLRELVVKQESLFYWTYCPKEHMDIEWVNVLTYGRNNYLPETVSAFTVAELGEMFSKEGEMEYPKYNARINKWERELLKGGWISCDTEANSRGKMLIYLLENDLIKL